LEVRLEPGCALEELQTAEIALGIKIDGSYRSFLLEHNGIELTVVRPAESTNDVLQVLSVDEAVRITRFINETIVEVYEDADRETYLRRYLACADLLDVRVLLDLRAAQVDEPPVVLSRPGDLWMLTKPPRPDAVSFDDWLTRSLESMATTAFGFDYAAESPRW
jgi:hypothetical protein